MSLFFVQHQHDPQACPARDPEQGKRLMNHLSPENARSHGIRLLADAVLDGKHTFNLILEADDMQQVSQFLQPFQQAGSLEIHPASHCEKVVNREGC